MTPTTENPYPGLQIPKNVLFNTSITNIQLKEQHSNPPIYPDDYLFNTGIEVRDLSNNYSIATINNEVKTVDAWTDYNQTDDIEDLGNGLLRVTSFCPEDENNPSNDLYANQIERIINISQYQQVVTGHILKKLRFLHYHYSGHNPVLDQDYSINVQDWELSEDNPTIPGYYSGVYSGWMVYDPTNRQFLFSKFEQPQTLDHKVWIVSKNHSFGGRGYYDYFLIDQDNAQVQLFSTEIDVGNYVYVLPTNWVPDFPTTTTPQI